MYLFGWAASYKLKMFMKLITDRPKKGKKEIKLKQKNCDRRELKKNFQRQTLQLIPPQHERQKKFFKHTLT